MNKLNKGDDASSELSLGCEEWIVNPPKLNLSILQIQLIRLIVIVKGAVILDEMIHISSMNTERADISSLEKCHQVQFDLIKDHQDKSRKIKPIVVFQVIPF